MDGSSEKVEPTPSALGAREAAKKELQSVGMAIYSYPQYQNDRELVLAAVRADGMALKYASSEMRRRNDIVCSAIESNPLALEFAGRRWKDEHSLVLRALRGASMKDVPKVLSFASEALQADPGFLLRAVLCDPESLLDFPESALKANGISSESRDAGPLSKELLHNRDFVATALRSDGTLLEWLDDDLKSDRPLVLDAVKNNGAAIQYVNARLGSDESFLLNAITANPAVIGSIQASESLLQRAVDQAPLAIVYLPHERANSYIDNAMRKLVTAPQRVVDLGRLQRFQELFNTTYEAKASNDRKGAPIPQAFHVRYVYRVDNAEQHRLHENYAKSVYATLEKARTLSEKDQNQRIAELKRKLVEVYNMSAQAVHELIHAPLKTDVFLADGANGKGDSVLVSTGERWLLHGTSFPSAVSIMNTNFKLGDGMLGRGCYFCESSTKADEHTLKDDQPPPALHAIILSEVTLGNIFIQHWDRAKNRVGFERGVFHSGVGFGKFREFAVADTKAIRPTYLVLYTRQY